jgi:IS5 family transposase
VLLHIPSSFPSWLPPERNAKSKPNDPRYGHTLGPVIADPETLTSVGVRRFTATRAAAVTTTWIRSRSVNGQVRRVTKTIRPEMRRRAAAELEIGHLKDDHRMGRNYLKGRDEDNCYEGGPNAAHA